MARARRDAASVNFANRGEARQWFAQQPREVAVTLAVRAALRSLPLLVRAHEVERFEARIALPVFRAVSVAWAAAEQPAHAERLRQPAAAAYAAADAAADAAAAAADAAAATATAYATAYAAYAAAATADAATTDAVQRDAIRIESGHSATDVASMPLWLTDAPLEAISAWQQLKGRLISSNDDWDVWTAWYEERLRGETVSRDLEIARATLPDALWEQGPAAVNARIKELITEHTPPQPIPGQGVGPHFALSPDLKIALAPPGEIDAAGNNLARIGNLLPVVRQAAGDLAGHLNPNTQPEISRIVGDYRAAIAGEAERVAWGTVFGLGVRLENAAAASRREIADRLRDPLEDAPQEALDSLLALHGPLMLATAEGRELSDDADHFVQTREQQAELRRDAQLITASLKNSPEIIEAPAASLGEEAAAAIGEGPHPERGTVFGLATLKHAATIFVPAATLASFVPVGIAAAGLLGGAVGGGIAWAGYESLKKSRRFSTATEALGPVWDQLLTGGEVQAARVLVRLAPFRNFVARNEEPLRRIAEHSTPLRWMLSYIDFITQGERR